MTFGSSILLFDHITLNAGSTDTHTFNPTKIVQLSEYFRIVFVANAYNDAIGASPDYTPRIKLRVVAECASGDAYEYVLYPVNIDGMGFRQDIRLRSGEYNLFTFSIINDTSETLTVSNIMFCPESREEDITKIMDSVVNLDKAYYGVTVSEESGLTIERSDGASEAVFNSDVFAMRAKVGGIMTDILYFDALLRNFVFNGILGADAILTDSIYAETGYIAELTVDRLSTSKKVQLYNLQNTSDDNFLDIRDNYQRLITGTVIFENGVPLTEQATNRYGQALYWQRKPVSINAQGYPLDENGVQIYASTEVPTPGEGETLDDYKVMVYQYAEQTKAQLAFELQDGVYIPKLILGAGDNLGRSKGFIYKDSASLLLRYLSSAGKNVDIVFSDDGFVDAMHRRLSAVALDTDSQTIIYTVEGSNSYHTLTYAISGDTITFTWPDGHTCDINIPDDGGGGGGGGGGGPAPSGSLPAMDGVASAGEFTMYSRGDHVHPTDTSRQAIITASGILKGNGSGGVTAATPGTDYGTYSKPSGGIPASDLASGVQTSLGKADSAYQKPSGGIPASDLASGVIPTVPNASDATPQALGTAAAGSSVDYSRADHVHQKPTYSASDVGLGNVANERQYSAQNPPPLPSAADIGAQPAIMANGILKGDGTGGVSAATPGTDYGTYSKPSGGIPNTDLASGVQTSLGKADSAYQKPSGGIPATDLASGVIPSVPSASAANPQMDGTASPGSSGSWARGDHVHPTDTTRQAVITASGILKGDGVGGVSAAVAGTDYGTYSKPSGGIPASDLASAVQTSLGKADTAYQKPSGGIPSQEMTFAVQTALSKADTAYQKPSGGIPASDLASGVQTSLGKADSAYQKPSGGIPASDLAAGVIPSVPAASSSDPAMDGTASPGSSGSWARGDHVHPSDTSRVPTSRTINGYDLTADRSLTAADVGAEPADSKILKNNAGNASSLSVMGGATPAAAGNMVALGTDAWTGNSGDIAIGKSSRATGTTSMALGFQAVTTGANAIQLGAGTNADANTLKVGYRTLGTNYELLDANGIIPPGRMPVDAAPTSASDNLVTSGGIYTAIRERPPVSATLWSGNTAVTLGGTTITLDANWSNYTGILLVLNTDSTIPTSSRMVLYVPTVALQFAGYYVTQNNSVSGAVRVGRPSGQIGQLMLYNVNFSYLCVTGIYGIK